MIPSSLYKKFVENMPISSVEAMIVKDDSILFLKRGNKPAKGEWWFPGGRIRKGETFQETLYRNVLEETGLQIEITRFIGVYNRIFPERHDISIVFLCNTSKNNIKLNKEHSEYKFFKEIPRSLHPYLLRVIQESGW